MRKLLALMYGFIFTSVPTPVLNPENPNAVNEVMTKLILSGQIHAVVQSYVAEGYSFIGVSDSLTPASGDSRFVDLNFRKFDYSQPASADGSHAPILVKVGVMIEKYSGTPTFKIQG